MESQPFPFLTMNRRHFLPALLALLSPSLWASDVPAQNETAEPPFWVAGGRGQGTAARETDWALGSFDLLWAGYKWWGVEKSGELIYVRPGGKDRYEKGTEYFCFRQKLEMGDVAGKKLMRLELHDEDDDNAPARSLFFGFVTEPDGGAKQFEGFFFLAGAKGEKLTSVFNTEKDPAGRLIVTAQPSGKGAARTYEFAFPKGVAELVVPAKAAKGK